MSIIILGDASTANLLSEAVDKVEVMFLRFSKGIKQYVKYILLNKCLPPVICLDKPSDSFVLSVEFQQFPNRILEHICGAGSDIQRSPVRQSSRTVLHSPRREVKD